MWIVAFLFQERTKSKDVKKEKDSYYCKMFLVLLGCQSHTSDHDFNLSVILSFEIIVSQVLMSKFTLADLLFSCFDDKIL